LLTTIMSMGCLRARSTTWPPESRKLDIVATFCGSQNGLGVIMQDALRFTYTGRILLIGFVFVLYADLSYYAIQALTAHAIRWHAGAARQSW